MAILIRANEIREPLDDSLLARHAKSFAERTGNTSGIGTSRKSSLASTSSASGWCADVSSLRNRGARRSKTPQFPSPGVFVQNWQSH